MKKKYKILLVMLIGAMMAVSVFACTKVPEKYAINYHLGEGETNHPGNPAEYEKGDTPVTLGDPDKRGYSFDGWYDGEEVNADKIEVIPEGSTGAVNLYARWTVITYTITYHLGQAGDEVTNPNPGTYTIEDDTLTLAEAQWDDHYFSGWYDAQTGGNKITSIPKGSIGNKVFYARWQDPMEKYAINYHLGEGETNHPDNPAEYEKEDTPVTLGAPDKRGYSFDGWYDGEGVDADKIEVIPESSTGALDLYARWTVIAYNITYHLEGGINHPDNVSSYTVEDNDIVLYSPTRIIDTFLGFFDGGDENALKIETIPAGSTGHIDLYARWQPADWSQILAYTVSSSSVTVTGLKTAYNDITGLVIPSEIEGKPVLIIAQNAFKDKTKLTVAIISENVTTISKDAFYGCSGIGTLQLPSTLTTIGDTAFRYCSSLTSVTLPGKLRVMGMEIFKDCALLESAVLEDGIPYVANSLFQNCQSLLEVTLPESITEIQGWAFRSCYELRTVTALPNLKYIRRSAFYLNYELTAFTFPAGLEIIENDAFYMCRKLESVILPDTVTALGESVFRACDGITTLVLSNSLKEIPFCAFYLCESLVNVIVPEGVTTIGDYAFDNCVSLESITLPSTLTTIGNGAVQECGLLTELILPSGLTYIGVRAFNGLAISEIHIPAGVTEICISAFNRWTQDQTIYFAIRESNIPNLWSEYWMEGCEAVMVWLPEAVTHTVTYNLNYGTNDPLNPDLYSTEGEFPIVLLDPVKHGFPFNGWYDANTGGNKIETITADMGDVELFARWGTCYYMYAQTGDITLLTRPGVIYPADIIIPASIDGRKVTGIEENLFKNTNIETLIIPEGITTIGDSAFQGCTELKSVTLPSTLTTLGVEIFTGCTKLEDITFTAGLTLIGGWMFRDCTAIEDLLLPRSIREIGQGAFQGCTSVWEFNMPVDIVTIGAGAFAYWTADQYIIIPITEAQQPEGWNGNWRENCNANVEWADEVIVYNIEYNLHLGTNNRANPDTYSVNSEFPITFLDPTLEGYSFSGWYPTNTASPSEKITGIEEGTTGDIELFARWRHPYLLYGIEGDLNLFVQSPYTPIPDIVEIPATINGRNVVGLYEDIFENRPNILSVSLPEGLQSIGAGAFSGCTGIASITIPSTVTTVGAGAFAGWMENQTIYIPFPEDGLPAGWDIGWRKDCYAEIVWASAVNTYNIIYHRNLGTNNPENPDTYSENSEFPIVLKNPTLQDHTFAGWYTANTGGVEVTEIKETDTGDIVLYARWNHTLFTFGSSGGDITLWSRPGVTLSGDIVIPATINGRKVVGLDKELFLNKTEITSVTLPEGLTTIGEAAFRGCTGLTSMTIPSTVINIGIDVFLNCTKLLTVIFEVGATTVGGWMFQGCTSLSSITLPDSITTIGPGAFRTCTALKDIYLPAGVATIGANAFYNWTAEQTIHSPIDETEIPDGWDSNWDGSCSAVLDWNYIEED